MSAFVSVGAGAFAPTSNARAGVCGGVAAPVAVTTRSRKVTVSMASGKELRDRIGSVKNTQKITTAMKLVAAAKVRRAQDAVLRTRPFSETLQKVLGGLLKRLENEFLDVPLLEEREAKNVVLVVTSGDRGLCGGYNSNAIKQSERRVKELLATGVNVELITIGNKASQYFGRRPQYTVRRAFPIGQAPTAEQATEITDEILSEYLSGEVDRVELLYTRFVSLISSTPSVRTLLPLSPTGIETNGDEIFALTSKDGQFSVNSSIAPVAEAEVFPSQMIFEQDPQQLLNAILPLYLNGQVLRALQESVASELASRMSAMSNATDNAKQLSKDLTIVYNRARQAKITQEISEICAGSL
ncbi:ATP synthase gamma chain, chloroplastic [Porphyridium purpureum]|uniref:F-ATPase gamma subunit n=1 Tax=Porphyridium purpureum TaxID=35688 RepID=A0A5J4Z1R1_PORPP|nr:ATP synthase gamma chain, chloroplastic [Porphyridium purpureum]|eukprot:POR7078..scf295_1